eukprot:6205617-Pleurochrysis_carterae.AAC.4
MGRESQKDSATKAAVRRLKLDLVESWSARDKVHRRLACQDQPRNVAECNGTACGRQRRKGCPRRQPPDQEENGSLTPSSANG